MKGFKKALREAKKPRGDAPACPECGREMGAVYARKKGGKGMKFSRHYCDGCEPVAFYEGKLEDAIVDALNVLGVTGACKAKHCLGCEYERGEAQKILYAALGINAWADPVAAHRRILEKMGAGR